MAIIKAGTYKWNDLLDLDFFPYGLTVVEIPFTTPEIPELTDGKHGSFKFNIHTKFTDASYGDVAYGYRNPLDGPDLPVYSNAPWEEFEGSTPYWAVLNIATEGAIAEGYGQTFTVTSSTEVSEAFGVWFEENTSPQGQTTSASVITYNGVTREVEAGKVATLACNAKKMKSDVVIVFGSDGTINYNGMDTPVGSGKTATLRCAGKKMMSDVRVVTESAVK